MKYYIVDFENVNTHGLNGIENIAEGDIVCIFYSDFASTAALCWALVIDVHNNFNRFIINSIP